MIEENDLVVKQDRHYTQGIKLSYFHSDDTLPLGSRYLYERLPELGFQSVVGRLGYAVGQNIYTPANTASPRLQGDDRPYAGWLYLGTILQRRGWSLGHRLTEEDYELELGVIGPWALADEAQTWVHEMRGFDVAKGWKYQLKNEPGIRLKYSRAVRAFEVQRGGWGFDITPHAGTSLGNVESSLRAGAVVRAGFHLPDDFGYHIIDSLATSSGGRSGANPFHWGFYVFGGVEGRLVLFNETLDGSVYQDSPSVQGHWVVGDGVCGFVVSMNLFEVGYAQAFRTPEFRGQTEHDSFGSVFFKARF